MGSRDNLISNLLESGFEDSIDGALRQNLRSKARFDDIYTMSDSDSLQIALFKLLLSQLKYFPCTIIKSLISQNDFDINYVINENTLSLLQCACQFGQIAMVKFLLENGANIHLKFLGKTPLYLAASSNSNNADSVVSLLLKYGAVLDFETFSTVCTRGNVNMIDHMLLMCRGEILSMIHVSDPTTRSTLLMSACKQKDERVVRFLLDNGAISTIHHKDIDGQSALMYASKVGKSEIIEQLLLNDGNHQTINTRDNQGRTALMHAITAGKYDAVSILLQRGAMRNTNTDKTLLMLACIAKHSGIVRLLLNSGEAVNYVDNKGQTALMHACRNGAIDAVDILLEYDANLDSIDFNGDNAILHAFAAQAHRAVTKIILKGPTRYTINLPNQFGITPLMYASEQNDLQNTKLLLQHGATDVINETDEDGITALTHAVADKYFSDEIFSVLLRNGAGHSLFVYSKSMHANAIDLIIKNGHYRGLTIIMRDALEMINSKDTTNGKTILIYCCETHDVQAVSTLFNNPQHQHININQSDDEGRTAFIATCSLGFSFTDEANAIANILLDQRDIDVKSTTRYRRTALWHAAQNGHWNITSKLLDRFDWDSQVLYDVNVSVWDNMVNLRSLSDSKQFGNFILIVQRLLTMGIQLPIDLYHKANLQRLLAILKTHQTEEELLDADNIQLFYYGVKALLKDSKSLNNNQDENSCHKKIRMGNILVCFNWKGMQLCSNYFHLTDSVEVRLLDYL